MHLTKFIIPCFDDTTVTVEGSTASLRHRRTKLLYATEDVSNLPEINRHLAFFERAIAVQSQQPHLPVRPISC